MIRVEPRMLLVLPFSLALFVGCTSSATGVDAGSEASALQDASVSADGSGLDAWRDAVPTDQLQADAPRPQPGAPVLFFSDLESGPLRGWNGSSDRGAAVSVWGLAFGPRAPAAKLRVCGYDLPSTSDEVVEWDAPGRARGLRRITFWLNSAMSVGPCTIEVITAKGTSNPLAFTSRLTGRIFFVDDCSGCSDQNDGTHDEAQGTGIIGPWRNPHRCKAISAGDICYVRAGTYRDADPSSSGTFLVYWSDNGDNGGNASAGPKSWVGYPGERVQLGDGGTHGFGFKNINECHGAHLTIAKFDFDIAHYLFRSGLGDLPDGARGHFRLVALRADHQTGRQQYAAGNIHLASSRGPYAVLGCYFENLNFATSGWDHNIYISTWYDKPGGTVGPIHLGYNEFAGGDDPEFNQGSAIKLHGKDSCPITIATT